MKGVINPGLAVILLVIAVLALSQMDYEFLEASLTGQPIYYKLTDGCEMPLSSAVFYNHFSDAGKDKYRTGTVTSHGDGIFSFKPSSYISSKGIYVCDGPKWTTPTGSPITNIDFNDNPPAYIARTDVSCGWIEKDILQRSGGVIDSPINLMIGDCFVPEPPPPVVDPPVVPPPVIEPPTPQPMGFLDQIATFIQNILNSILGVFGL